MTASGRPVLDLADLADRPAELVGGKAAGLGLMIALGLPVPPGFVLTTEVWRSRRDGLVPPDVLIEVDAALARLETRTRRRLGGADRPLLVSVRSGAARSMPGMMDTVLDLGLTPAALAALAREAGEDVAAGCHRRFVRTYRRATGAPPPDDARGQLVGAIEGVMASWDAPRARAYREAHGIAHDAGTAVVVQAMVLGDRGPGSGTGVATSRDPDTGRPGLTGDYLPGAQGEDVVDGAHDPLRLDALAEALPEVAERLATAVAAIEARMRDAVEVEFTVEEGALHLLQCRVANRAAPAAVRIAVDLVDEGAIAIAEAVERVSPSQLASATRPSVDVDTAGPPIATGTGACPGVVAGAVCLSSERVEELAATGRPVVLVRPETSPEDLPGMLAAAALLTSTGGPVSHAALVARELDLPTVVGVSSLVVDEAGHTIRIGGVDVREGDVVTIDGGAGTVHLGAAVVRDPVEDERVARFRRWLAELRGSGG